MDTRYLDQVRNVVVSDGEQSCSELAMGEQFELIEKDRYFLCEIETAKQFTPRKFNIRLFPIVYN